MAKESVQSLRLVHAQASCRSPFLVSPQLTGYQVSPWLKRVRLICSCLESYADTCSYPAVPADPELSAGSATRTPAATSNESQDQSAPSNDAAASTSQPHQLPESLASASNASAGPSSSSAAGPSGSSSASLDTIDDICIAITSIDSIHGNPNTQYKRVCQSLLPALQHLESKGTHLGVPGAVVLCSPLQGNHDPLQVLLTQIPPNGVGLGYLFIL